MHLELVSGFVFLELCAELGLVDLGAEVLLLTAPVVTLLNITGLFLLHSDKLVVISSVNKVTLGDGTSLLVLLHKRLLVWDKRGGLHGCEVAQLSKAVLLFVRFEEFAIKLIREVEGRGDRAETRRLEVKTKAVKVKIGAADLFNHSFSFRFLSCRWLFLFLRPNFHS